MVLLRHTLTPRRIVTHNPVGIFLIEVGNHHNHWARGRIQLRASIPLSQARASIVSS